MCAFRVLASMSSGSAGEGGQAGLLFSQGRLPPKMEAPDYCPRSSWLPPRMAHRKFPYLRVNVPKMDNTNKPTYHFTSGLGKLSRNLMELVCPSFSLPICIFTVQFDLPFLMFFPSLVLRTIVF